MSVPTYTELLRERNELLAAVDDEPELEELAVLVGDLRVVLQALLGSNRANDPPQVDDVWTAFERLETALEE